jgi:hypothetical protein
VAAAWVVIVAGIVFILATVFFAGAMIVGIGHQCYYRDHHGMMFKPGGPWGPGGGPWQYGGPYGPGMAPPFGPPPGVGPGGPGGPAGPGQLPTTSAPAPNTPGTPRP